MIESFPGSSYRLPFEWGVLSVVIFMDLKKDHIGIVPSFLTNRFPVAGMGNRNNTGQNPLNNF